MRLASEKALAEAAAGLAPSGRALDGYRADMLAHPAAGWCLRNYLVLTECPELLGHHGLSLAELHWSRYYWLVRFARVWSAVAGHDAGLEQQVLRLLADAPGELDAAPDVEAAAEQAAAEQMREAGFG